MTRTFLIRALFAATVAGCSPWCASASGLSHPAPTRVDLNGIINPDSDDTLAFTPDGRTVFFDRSEGAHKTIMVAHRVDGTWSPPQVASFSGRWFDQDPIVAPDGSYLLFNSDRPIAPGGKPLQQSYFGAPLAPGSNIWRSDRAGDGWAPPVRLPSTINDDVFIDFASVAADDSVYFMRWNAAGRAMQIWRSRLKGGEYQAPERIVVGDPAVSLHDPAVSPDQSFMLLDYGKVKGGLGRLSIAFRRGAQWGPPVDLGDTINGDLPWGAHLGPDGRTAYFTGRSGIWRLPLATWLDPVAQPKPGTGRGRTVSAVRRHAR